MVNPQKIPQDIICIRLIANTDTYLKALMYDIVNLVVSAKSAKNFTNETDSE